jgi:CubicO group peptidase (beta-lactamase class C family)
VVAEWGDTSARLELESVRKSLLSALIGIAVAEHQMSLDSSLEQLGIDDNPPALTGEERQATVRMLLQARSGVYHKALYESADMAANRPARGSHGPGSFWFYNNWDFNALGTLYERAVNMGIYEALDERIARPLGMQDYRPEDGHYVTGADSIHRAYALRMSARDLARFALLYARKGTWAGRQVVPADWVQESTQPYSVSGPGLGYGYMWWTAGAAPRQGQLPKGCFFAAGVGGQFAFVFPAIDLVLVHQIDEHLDLAEPSREDIGQLLRLTLKAGGFLPPP